MRHVEPCPGSPPAMQSVSTARDMLNLGLHRRQFLQIGALGCSGLALADVLRLQAQGGENVGRTAKWVIMICLRGGPSHIDMYDLKPEAPAEFRGEFTPIATNVAGLEICEHLPLQ